MHGLLLIINPDFTDNQIQSENLVLVNVQIGIAPLVEKDHGGFGG